MLGILLTVEIGNVFASWPDVSKIFPGAPILMTNCVHASKVIAFSFHAILANDRSD